VGLPSAGRIADNAAFKQGKLPLINKISSSCKITNFGLFMHCPSIHLKKLSLKLFIASIILMNTISCFGFSSALVLQGDDSVFTEASISQKNRKSP